MDDLVRQALAKWPDVPDCYGWLALDGRGRWRIGSDRQTISHAATIAFIQRNVLCDEQGRWLFQNGPQRVFIDLEYTPWVWRLVPGPGGHLVLRDHTGADADAADGAWLLEDGRFVIRAAARVGVVHDHDTALLTDCLSTADGTALPENSALEQLAALLEAPESSVTDVHVRLPGASRPVPLRRLDRASLGATFGFDPQPAAPG